MIPKEKQFIEVALELGYLNRSQAKSAYTLHKWYARNKANMDIAQIFLRKGYLDAQQVAEIMQQLPSISQFDISVIELVDEELAKKAQQQANKVPASETGDAEMQATRPAPEVAKDNGDAKAHPPPKKPVTSALPIMKHRETIAVGKSWHDFEILEEIGRGGMGIVYKARQKLLGRTVALKVLLTKSMSREQWKRFLKEAQLSAILEHPNIAKVFLADIYNDVPFIAMEYIEGLPLPRYYNEYKPKLTQFLELLLPITEALHYAHKQGIVHRDVKPANIVIAKDETPYLMDFGIARNMHVQDLGLTRTGQILGTPRYMSPEQAKGHGESVIDTRTDIYALGAIIYEAATGVPPIQGASPMEVLHNIVHTTPLPPKQIKSTLPLQLDAIISKAIAYDQKKRYQSIRQLGQDISSFLSGDTISQGCKIRLSRSHWLVVAIVICISLVAIAIGKKFTAPGKQSQQMQVKQQRILAKQHFQAQRYSEAEKCINKLLLLDPKDKDAIHFQAAILEQQQIKGIPKIKAMRLTWARLYEVAPTLDELVLIGQKALYWGCFADAHRYFATALNLDSDSPTLKKYMAQTLLYWGKYREAKKFYQQLQELQNEPQVILGLANIYYYEKQHLEALHTIAQLKGVASNSALQAQILFLQARIAWEQCEKDLNRWNWLSQQTPPDSPLKKKLQTIRQQMHQTLGKIGQIAGGNHNAYMKSLQEQIHLYLRALTLEIDDPFAEDMEYKFKKFSLQLQNSSLAPRFLVFFQNVALRFLVRRKDWQQTYQFCDRAIHMSPWVANFYHIRGLALFQHNEIGKCLADVLQAINLYKWDFIPIENTISLLFTRFTQQEFYELYRLLMHFIFQSSPQIADLVLKPYLQELQDHYVCNDEFLHVADMEPEQWQAMLKTVLQSESDAARQLAIVMLAREANNIPLQKQIKLLQAKVPAQQAQRLDQICKTMNKYKTEQYRQQIKQLLLKYAALKKNIYPVLMRKQGKKAETMLQQLIQEHDEPPMIRLLAARMLSALKTENGFAILKKLAASDHYPENLLTAVVLSEDGFPCQFNKSCVESSHNESEIFYRILFALHLDPQEHRQFADTLLHNGEDIVALCIASNLRNHLLPAKLYAKTNHRLLQMLASEQAYIRALASSVFWHIPFIYVDMRKKYQPAMEQQLKKLWEKHHNTLVQTMQDQNLQVKFAGIRTIVTNEVLQNIFWDQHRHPALVKIRRILEQVIQKAPYFMKFWGTMALGLVDRKGAIAKIVTNSSAPFFIRMAGALRAATRKTILFELFLHISSMLEKPARTESDLRFKLMALMVSARWKKITPLLPNIKPLLLRNMQDPDIRIRRVSIAAMLWYGKKKNINDLRPYLNSSDIHIRRAAATTLASLMLRYKKSKLKKFNNRLQKLVPQIRQAAAFGYYHPILERILRDRNFLHARSIDEEYASYLRCFKEKIKPAWLQHLRNANTVDPQSRYAYEMSLVYHKLRQFEHANSYLLKALELCSPNQSNAIDAIHDINSQKARCLLLQADILLEQQNYQQALELLRQAEFESPIDSEINLTFGRVWLRKKKYTKARYYFWQSYQCNPNVPDAFRWLAVTHIQTGDRDKALKLLQDAHERFPVKRGYYIYHPHFRIFKNHPWVHSIPR